MENIHEDSMRVERLTSFCEADAEALGRLMPYLSQRFSGEPVPEEILQSIIDSPCHDQFVARLDGRIVGAATLNLVFGVGGGKKGQLEDFVVDPEVRSRGVGSKVWSEIIAWCHENNVDLHFTSSPSREAAHVFYRKQGANVRETTVFELRVP